MTRNKKADKSCSVQHHLAITVIERRANTKLNSNNKKARPQQTTLSSHHHFLNCLVMVLHISSDYGHLLMKHMQQSFLTLRLYQKKAVHNM